MVRMIFFDYTAKKNTIAFLLSQNPRVGYYAFLMYYHSHREYDEVIEFFEYGLMWGI